MKSIGIIQAERLKNIPRRYWAHHEFCFHLHDLMTSLLAQMEIQKAGHVKFEIQSEEDRRLLASDIHILDFLAKSGRGDLKPRAVINHVCNALFSDMLHFIYESLRALEKRKFTVANDRFGDLKTSTKNPTTRTGFSYFSDRVTETLAFRVKLRVKNRQPQYSCFVRRRDNIYK